MEITGRLTADAEIRKTKNNRELVAFTIVVNDYFRTKDGEKKEVSEFFNCSYWLNTKIADNLLKGSIITVSGRIYLNEFKGRDREHHAYLAIHVNGIKIVGSIKKGKSSQQPVVAATTLVDSPDIKEDLPF